MRTRIIFSVILSLLLTMITTVVAGQPSVNEIKKTEYFLVKFEKHVKRARGKPFTLSYDDKDALKRVRALREKHPTDPKVEELFNRARTALMASKGDFMQITPEMLAYRDIEKRLVASVGAEAKPMWTKLSKTSISGQERLPTAFPVPNPREVDPETVLGKYVVLEDFRYPNNEFTDDGGQYVFCGSPGKGYYFVQLSNRSWMGAYTAVQRYKRAVSQDIPLPWGVVGQIDGVAMLVPQAGEEKSMSPYVGWRVRPMVLYVPDRVVGVADAELELGGYFSGEAELETLKSQMYTVKEVPTDVQPLDLVRILATAVKEKNWPLVLDCIDPVLRKTPKALARLRYFYDNNLERYRRWYVYIDPYELKGINIIRGYTMTKGSDEDFFLTDSQKSTLQKHSEKKVEEAVVMIRPFDENGKQSALPRKVILRRYENGRWYVYTGFPL